MSDNSIARVYQFLTQYGENWKKDADANNDDTIIKSEFYSFTLNNMDWTNEDTDAAKKDIINKFWASIDVNTSGKISGSGISNVNALDSKELEAMSKKIELYNKLEEFLNGQNMTPPSVIANDYKSDWTDAVEQGYITLIESNKNPINDLDKFLQDNMNRVKNKATAQTVARQYLAGNNDLQNLQQYYTMSKDKNLQNIIDGYIKSLPENATPNDIKSGVEKLINNYLSTAGLKTGNVSELAQYGYKVGKYEKLNDIQVAVLRMELESKIKVSDWYEDYADNKDLYDKAKSGFINDVLTNADAKFSNFDKIKAYGKAEFEASSSYVSAKAAIDAKAAATAVQETEAPAEETTVNTAPTIEDKTLSIYNELSSVINKEGALTFRVLNNGTVEFVDNDNDIGVFAADKNMELDNIFNVTVKNEILKQYKTELDEVFGNDTKAINNLYNLALLTVLESSDELYKPQVMQQTITKVIKTFVSMLKKAASDSAVKEYITNYPTSSLLAGRTLGTDTGKFAHDVNGTMTNDMRDYYKDDSCEGGNDRVRISSHTSKTFTCPYASGEILYINGPTAQDNTVVNNSLEKLLNDYINNYKDLISPSTIISRFKDAEAKAFEKLQKAIDSNDKNVYRNIYGYSDGAETIRDWADFESVDETCATVQAILLQVMFEMDLLINKEMFGV